MIFIVLPSYNEGVSLRDLLPALTHALEGTPGGFRVLVVDDGSTDDTGSVAEREGKKSPIVLIRHLQNQGYGAAVQTGLTWCLENGHSGDVVVTMDADRSHPPALIPELVSKIQSGCGAVTASPFTRGGSMTGVPFYRLVLTHTANRLFRSLIGAAGITSYTSGFRAYRYDVLAQVFQKFGPKLQSTGFTASTELFLKASLLSAKLGEVALPLRYDLKPGRSKMRVLPTIGLYLGLIRQYRRWRNETRC